MKRVKDLKKTFQIADETVLKPRSRNWQALKYYYPLSDFSGQNGHVQQFIARLD